jgi:hypothetical protein
MIVRPEIVMPQQPGPLSSFYRHPVGKRYSRNDERGGYGQLQWRRNKTAGHFGLG